MEYTRSIITHIDAGKFNLDAFTLELVNSNINTPLSFCNVEGDEITFVFSATLSPEYEAMFDNLLKLHDGNPIPEETIPQSVEIIAQPEPEPFAKPSFRTKRDGAPSWIDIGPDSNLNSDYYITEERYVSGGEVLTIDAKKGDWISAEVIDIDGVLPEIYRPVLAENYPTLNKYVIRANILPGTNKYVLDTYPLNAKITPGFYLRITYHTSAELGTRSFIANYYLTQKLDLGE